MNLWKAHNSYKTEGFDGDIILKDVINSVERQVAHGDVAGTHGFGVYYEFGDNICHIAHVYEVHQLQNLFHGLCGEELTPTK